MFSFRTGKPICQYDTISNLIHSKSCEILNIFKVEMFYHTSHKPTDKLQDGRKCSTEITLK